MQLGSILGAMTGSRFVGIRPGGEQDKAHVVFVGGELSLISEAGLGFGWFEWRCVEVFLKASTVRQSQYIGGDVVSVKYTYSKLCHTYTAHISINTHTNQVKSLYVDLS